MRSTVVKASPRSMLLGGKRGCRRVSVWELTLSCGHVTERRTKVPPKSVVCRECRRKVGLKT